MTVDTKHYDKFDVKLTKKEIKAGTIRLDPYRISKEWNVGANDPSGALFHILKTICRYKGKKGNSYEREASSILATITRLVELNKDDSIKEKELDLEKSIQEASGIDLTVPEDLIWINPPTLDESLSIFAETFETRKNPIKHEDLEQYNEFTTDIFSVIKDSQNKAIEKACITKTKT